LGKDSAGNDVFLKDIWPMRDEVDKLLQSAVTPQMYRETYASISTGSEQWQNLNVNKS